jgi:uncharacterized membrane protein
MEPFEPVRVKTAAPPARQPDDAPFAVEDIGSAAEPAEDPPAEAVPSERGAPAAGAPDPTAAQTPPAASATVTARYGSRRARSFADRLRPGDTPFWIWGISLVLYTLVIIVLTRACSG